MKASLLRALTLSSLILASPACAGDRAAADPNALPTTDGAARAAAAPAGAPASPDAAAQAAQAAAPSTPVPSATPRDPNAAAAKVNGVPILEKSFQEAVHEFLAGQGTPAGLPDDQMAQVRQAVMDALIGTELVYQKSKSDGVKVGKEEIDGAVAEGMKQFPTVQAFEDSLKQQGTDKASYMENVSRNLAINKLIQAQVFDKITITDADAKAYYDQHPAEMQKPEEVRASHILIRNPQGSTAEQKKAAQTRAQEALDKVKAGGDFAAVAKEYSQDPGSGANGGDLGFFGRGRMVPAFDNVAFSMKVGQVSAVIETQFGFHVIKITDHHDAQTAPFEDLSSRLKDFLKQKKARGDVQAYLRTLRDGAKVEVF